MTLFVILLFYGHCIFCPPISIYAFGYLFDIINLFLYTFLSFVPYYRIATQSMVFSTNSVLSEIAAVVHSYSFVMY